MTTQSKGGDTIYRLPANTPNALIYEEAPNARIIHTPTMTLVII